MKQQPLHSRQPAGVFRALVAGTAVVAITVSVLSYYSSSFKIFNGLLALGVWSAIALLIWTTAHNHRHERFGSANYVTLMRAVLATLLASLIPIADAVSSPGWLWLIAITATLTLCMDGLDGYLARKFHLCSDFGARFDMETDAFIGLVITLFIWQSGKVGFWIIGLGTLRYLFVFASIFLASLRAELFPSMRRKAVCVIQVGALCLMLCPWLSSAQASIVGILGLACLMFSFFVDVHWLLQQHHASQKLPTMHNPDQSRTLKNTNTRPGKHPSRDVSA